MSKLQRLILASSLTFLTTSALFGEAHCPGNVAPLRYHSLQNSQIDIPVSINGSRPYEFLVDTGSQMTIIEPSLAAELQLSPVGHAGVTSGVNRAEVDMVR